MQANQIDKAVEFQRLHTQTGPFVTPNPWDAGSARLLADLGFPALASTGAGYAFSCGLSDKTVGRQRMMDHLRELAAATRLPVSADLENGFGDTPEAVATTIRLAAEAGVVGGSIEDATGKPDAPLYPLSLAVERIQAAVEASRALSFPFVLTARAENFVVGRPDLDDAIRRLQAYQEAGADVLFAPGLTQREDIASVIASVDRPLNVMMGGQGMQLSLPELGKLGVKRISLGASLARAAQGELLRAAREIREAGSFTYTDRAVSARELHRVFSTF